MFNRKLPYRMTILVLEVFFSYIIATVVAASFALTPFMLGPFNMTVFALAIAVLLLFEVIPWRKLIR